MEHEQTFAVLNLTRINSDDQNYQLFLSGQ